MQRIANPSTSVRFRLAPPLKGQFGPSLCAKEVVMRNLKSLILIATMVLGASGTCAYARPGGAGGGSAGGMAGSHMSQQGLANTNGPRAADRDKGLDRAADRRNEEAAEHSKAGQSKKHMKKSGKAAAKAEGSATAK